MAGRQMSALVHLGANGDPLRHKPILSHYQKAIAATAESEPYATSSLRTLKVPGECMTERHQKSKSPSPTPSPSGTRHENNDSRMQLLLPSYRLVENQGRSSLDNLPGQPAHQKTPQSPQDPIGRTSQGPLLFNSGPSPNESAQPVPLHFHPPMNMLTHNPADMPSTTSTSASPATPTNASPVSDSSTRLSAIQTVQNYLTHQAQAIQLHLTAVLPGLIQGEVRTQCTQLAQEIGAQISLIWEELIRPTRDQDDPMLSSSEENEGSRGHGKQPSRHSCNKGKGKKARSTLESNNNAADSSQQPNNEEGSQQPNNENEAAEGSQQPNSGDKADEDKGSENESDKEKIGAGSWKYKKQIKALREPLQAFLLQKSVVVREEHGLPTPLLPPCAPAIHVKQFVEKHTRIRPDTGNIQYNCLKPLGLCPWNCQVTLLLAKEYLELYRGGGIKVNRCILPYNPKVDLKTIQKTICQRLFCTHTYWKKQNLPNNGNNNTTAVPSTMQEQAEGRVTMTRHWTHGTKSLEDQEANVRMYFNGDLKKELLNMLHRLQSAGMNYDITDSESSDQALQSCMHWWLSPSVISILQELDTLGKRAKVLRLISKKGNQPLPWTMNAKIVYNSTNTISLPKNW